MFLCTDCLLFVRINLMFTGSSSILKSTSDLTPDDLRVLHTEFNSPIAELDCGRKCASHNPSGKPFCCDICQAVPAAYKSEWNYFEHSTDLWHKWRGEECADTTSQDVARLEADTPTSMVLLACLGPARCQRDFRALSCRQFPFFPYVTSEYRFIGLVYEWQFESTCWVISNLSQVTQKYRQEFIRTYDRLFALFQDEFDHYAYHSELMRSEVIRRKKRFPLLHRNGRDYLVSAASERLRRMDLASLPCFGYYR